MYEEIKQQGQKLTEEFIEKAKLAPGSLLVIGCSTSEILGDSIGSNSAYEAAEALLEGILPVLNRHNIHLAAQCCEHLNRALVIEQETAEKFGLEPVCVIPQPKAGGSFATACYRNFKAPVVVEAVSAHAGIDIGSTLIGMHLKAVAVPLRLCQNVVGKANVVCAYTRPKLIGGQRAVYP